MKIPPDLDMCEFWGDGTGGGEEGRLRCKLGPAHE